VGLLTEKVTGTISTRPFGLVEWMMFAALIGRVAVIGSEDHGRTEHNDQEAAPSAPSPAAPRGCSAGAAA